MKASRPLPEEKKPNRRCSACGQVTYHKLNNPLLGVPLCVTCYDIYMAGKFPIDDANEIFCRWCGEGKDELILCDSCPKSFCSRCISRNFGPAELRRIRDLDNGWSCFVCSPKPLESLARKRGWDTVSQTALLSSTSSSQAAAKRAKAPVDRTGLVCLDISRGRERIEIPVINKVDDAPAPIDFTYISRPVAGKGVVLRKPSSNIVCCACTDDCSNPQACACLRISSGQNYDFYGRLLQDKPGGIFECNPLCSCHTRRCKNRVVGSGPSLPLEVFRCENPKKGWGVRCREDIPAGTFIATYLGEILLDADADVRGLNISDEYLYDVDNFGRSVASHKLKELGLMASLSDIPREVRMNSTILSENAVREVLGSAITDLLVQKGAIQRAMQRRDEIRAKIEQDLASFGSARPLEMNWFSEHTKRRQEMVTEAGSVINDRCVMEVSDRGDQLTIDAR